MPNDVLPASPASGPARGEASNDSGDFRVVVDSIGRADARLIAVLARALGRSEQQMAELLLRTPAILLDAVPRELAEQTARLLAETGIDVRVMSRDAPFVAGDDNFEVALIVHELDHVTELVAEVARLVGCAVPQAIELVCATPAVLIGGISAGTVEALRERFGRWGAELAVTDARLARYDVFVAESEPNSLGRVARLLDGLGLARNASAGPLIASDLDRSQALALWERLRGSGGPLRVLDREFARFDIRLLGLGAAPSPELAQWLADDTGMPIELARDLGRHLPLILHEELPRERAEACLLALAELSGGEARAEALLTTFQTFDLELQTIGERGPTLELLAGLGRVPGERLAELEPQLARLPLRIPGPFAKLRARWLVHECARIGTQLELVPR